MHLLSSLFSSLFSAKFRGTFGEEARDVSLSESFRIFVLGVVLCAREPRLSRYCSGTFARWLFSRLLYSGKRGLLLQAVACILEGGKSAFRYLSTLPAKYGSVPVMFANLREVPNCRFALPRVDTISFSFFSWGFIRWVGVLFHQVNQSVILFRPFCHTFYLIINGGENHR